MPSKGREEDDESDIERVGGGLRSGDGDTTELLCEILRHGVEALRLDVGGDADPAEVLN